MQSLSITLQLILYTLKEIYLKILINAIQKNHYNNKILKINSPSIKIKKNIMITIKINKIIKNIINTNNNGNRFKTIIYKITKIKFLNKTVFYLEKIDPIIIKLSQTIPKIYLIIMIEKIYPNNNFKSITINHFQPKI